MRYILENGQLKKVDFISTSITNPSDEVLDTLGIGKVLIEEEKPEANKNQIIEIYYQDKEKEIIKKYRVVEEVGVDETDDC